MPVQIIIREELAFINFTLTHGKKTIVVNNVLLDSGSAATVVDTDIMAEIGIFPQNDDLLAFMVGIGGQEVTVEKIVDKITIGEVSLAPFTIQMARLNYDLGFNGILGLDFMLAAKLILNFDSLTVTTAT